MTMTLPLCFKKVRLALKTVYDHCFYKDLATYNKQIKKLHGKYKGERCFIIGTGPSLNKTNFLPIKNEILFGVNTLYNGLKKFDIDCKYWGVSDSNVFDKNYEALLNLDTTLFLADYAGREFLRKKGVYLKNAKIEPLVLRTLGRMNVWNKFSRDMTKGIFSAGNVVIMCIQIAYYMGFKEVYLVGCDCSWDKTIHFHSGDSNVKDLRKRSVAVWSNIFSSYELCKKVFEEDGRKIYNATVGGKLEVFERKNLDEIVKP